MTHREDIYPADRITLREVGLRDGLQLVRSFPDTEAGSRPNTPLVCFEAGSFLRCRNSPMCAR